MSEMIERVARALEQEITGKSFLSYEDAARAAIEAMREPSHAMLREGVKKALSASLAEYTFPRYIGDLYSDMIDAALKEKGQ